MYIEVGSKIRKWLEFGNYLLGLLVYDIILIWRGGRPATALGVSLAQGSPFLYLQEATEMRLQAARTTYLKVPVWVLQRMGARFRSKEPCGTRPARISQSPPVRPLPGPRTCATRPG